MQKSRVPDILFHPAIISLAVWIVIILSIPLSFSRYRIQTLSREAINPNLYIMFADLDSDGASERITFDLADLGQTKVIVYKGDKVFNQYNVASQPSNIQSVYFDDYNSDSFSEIYIFTLNDTTIFLSVIDPLGKGGALVSNREVDHWKKSTQSADKPNFTPVGLVPGADNKSRDLLFYISTGYSLQPRNVYRYSIGNDSLVKSPQSFATIYQCKPVSRTGNFEEGHILISVQASGNSDSTVPYSDAFSWLMVLDKDLAFTFDPINIGNYPSRITTIPVRYRDGDACLLLYDYFGAEDEKSMFYIYDENGNKLAEKVINDYEPCFSFIIENEADDRKSFYLLKNHDGTVDQMDMSFNRMHTYYLPALENGKPIADLDADLDGKKEHIFLGKGVKSLVISQNNFKSAVEFPLNDEGTNYLFSQILTPGEKPLIHLQVERNAWILSYESNPLYYLRWPLYILFYLLIFLFISMIYRIQKYRIEIKRATEREIASLQMKAIKNQIDPHFTLNVLNAIGGLYLTEDNRQKADYIFGKYASLIRQTVISSDKIIIPLEDELDFVRNYLDIERFRFGDTFEYSINVDPEVDTGMRIPRMLVYTFVENSVKHGLRRLMTGGVLSVGITHQAGVVQITVEDNGPGMANEGASSEGTGKGLKIVKELADLFHKLEKVRITIAFENLAGEDPTVNGTVATIRIPFRNS